MPRRVQTLERWLGRDLREWAWVIRRRLFPRARYVFLMDGDLRIGMDISDELAFHYALGRTFEPDITELVTRIVKPGMVVLDVGANVGHYTLLAAKRVGPAGSVHAFEPAPAEHMKLLANVELNGFLKHVFVNRVAVADRVGDQDLYLAGTGLGLYNSLAVPFRRSQTTRITVPCTTLDRYLLDNDLTRVHLLKIDAEGAELAVLRGATRLLSSEESPVIVCEFTDLTGAGLGHSTVMLRRMLEDLGYRVFRYSPEENALTAEPRVERYDYANLVCLKLASLSLLDTVKVTW